MLIKSQIVGLLLITSLLFTGCKLPGLEINYPIKNPFNDKITSSLVDTRLKVRDGFAIQLFATGIPNARFMQVTETGDVLISQPSQNQILLIKNSKSTAKESSHPPLLENLDRPHGLALYNDWLYIAEATGVVRIKFDALQGKTTGKLQRIISGLGDEGFHFTKSITFSPDNKLYVSIGSSCNSCEETDPKRAVIMQYNPDGSAEKVFARGVRNSVGLAWSPIDNQLYATDNGRDLMGDDFPPCELNMIQDQIFYGFPYFNGNNIPDPDFSNLNLKNMQPQSPAFSFPAHNAPLGITFLEHTGLPNTFKHSALVALHGSWNRSKKDGYKVVSLHWSQDKDGNQLIKSEDFIWGFEVQGNVIGRPVDIVEDKNNGAIYISDDYAGAIYKVVPIKNNK